MDIKSRSLPKQVCLFLSDASSNEDIGFIGAFKIDKNILAINVDEFLQKDPIVPVMSPKPIKPKDLVAPPDPIEPVSPSKPEGEKNS